MTDTNVVLLDTNPDLLLGVDPSRPRHDNKFGWDPDATLLLYTDGLVEDAQRSLTEGLSALTAALADIGTQPLDILCDRLVHRLSNGQRSDDIAILAIRNGNGNGRQDSAEAQKH